MQNLMFDIYLLLFLEKIEICFTIPLIFGEGITALLLSLPRPPLITFFT